MSVGDPAPENLSVPFCALTIVTIIEMMAINDELSNQELTDYIKQVLNYQKLLKIKEKEVELKEAERQSEHLKAAAIATEINQLRKSL